VAADYTGHYDAPCGVEDFGLAMLLFERRSIADFSHFTTCDSNRVPFQDSSLAVHRDEDAILYQQINQN
jgi:hypothetical protein